MITEVDLFLVTFYNIIGNFLIKKFIILNLILANKLVNGSLFKILVPTDQLVHSKLLTCVSIDILFDVGNESI
jgi:hypothetical protein